MDIGGGNISGVKGMEGRRGPKITDQAFGQVSLDFQCTEVLT